MKQIELTKNKIALVDDEDFDYLNQFKWYALNGKYVSRAYTMKNGKQRGLLMHRLIMNAPKEMEIDHINGNGLDNQRDNLRVCKKSENLWNSGKSKNNKSGYKGVCWSKVIKKWRVQIMINGKLIYLGVFKNIKDAAMAYKEASLKYHGKFAK